MKPGTEWTERVRTAVWSLLRWAEDPQRAVAIAHLQVDNVNFTEMDFRAALRAAGLFARDNDGYFVRYRSGANAQLEAPPEPTHQLVFPTVVEPRMRIAYNIFAGLLLKFLFQSCGAVPVRVQEGLAQLWAPNGLPDASAIWNAFKCSPIAEGAIIEGVDAALGALGQRTTIGSMPITPSLCNSAVWNALRKAIPRYLRKFQPQGGKVITFLEGKEVLTTVSQQDIGIVYQDYLSGMMNLPKAESAIASSLIHESAKEGILSLGSIGQTWEAWKKDQKRRPIPLDKEQESRLKALDNTLGAYDRRLRRDARTLQQWVYRKAQTNEACQVLLTQVQRLSVPEAAQLSLLDGSAKQKRDKSQSVALDQAVSSLDQAFGQEMFTFPIGKKPAEARRAAIALSVRAWVAWEGARILPDNMTVMGLPAPVVRNLAPEDAVMLRFVEGPTRQVALAFTIANKEVMSFGYTDNEQRAADSLPFVITDVRYPASATSPMQTIASGKRCIVCGATGDLLGGQKTFLPESKKRHYEQPGTEDNPEICSHCAFVAYLSSVVPQKSLSVVEFPVDDYLELFALHESLQGLAEQAALKELNRVATLSVLPSRYLLISLNTITGKIDTKTQVYLQLKNHAHLFRNPGQSIRVHVAGDQAHVWTEVLPVVAIGLGYFRRLPRHTSKEGQEKGAAYDIVNALRRGLPYAALYAAVRLAQGKKDSVRERDVLSRGFADYDERFVKTHRAELAQAAGGQTMKEEFYDDVIAFSNELFALIHPLVRSEVDANRSNASVVARKYTDLIDEEFGEGSPKLLYRLAQDADAAERNGDAWAKTRIFDALYGEPAPKAPGAEGAKAWDVFRQQHAKTTLEIRLGELRAKHRAKSTEWTTFLSEVRLRLLSLLLLNVRNIQK